MNIEKLGMHAFLDGVRSSDRWAHFTQVERVYAARGESHWWCWYLGLPVDVEDNRRRESPPESPLMPAVSVTLMDILEQAISRGIRGFGTYIGEHNTVHGHYKVHRLMDDFEVYGEYNRSVAPVWFEWLDLLVE